MQYQVLILAAGKGTRFRSELPKVLHKICGLTLLERVIAAASVLSGPGKKVQVTVVKGSGADLVEEELRSIAPKYPHLSIESVLQVEQRGTGDAVRAAADILGPERVLILPGDAPLLTKEGVLEIVSKDRGASLSVISCEPPSPFGYGRIVYDGSGKLQKIVEDKDCTSEQKLIREINSSLYLGDVQFIRDALKSLQPNNAQGELYFTDCVAYGVSQGRTVDAIRLSNWLDLAGANTRVELARLETAARERINNRVMEQGVTLENPANVFIDEEVTFGADIYLGSGTRLYGKTAIGDKVRVDGDTFIFDSIIGPGTHVKFCSMIESSTVEAGCMIGPFAHLRPKSEIREGAHIGNYVETKAAIIGKGSKANHLSYIGDAEIGAGVNIGAGAITCNFDGALKHKTIICDGVFIGSNSSLIAPITIEAGAYIGSGSVITKDVPADALALERNEQRVIPDWVKRRKKRER